MAEPFIAEVRMWANTYAPRGWAFCDGQLVDIAQNTALFSLIFTTFGGDGSVTMGLPYLQGHTPMFFGHGPGLTAYGYGQSGGIAEVPLSHAQMPAHNHTLKSYRRPGETNIPSNEVFTAGDNSLDVKAYGPDDGNHTQMASASLQNAGQSQPHENRQPFLALPFCIALEGIYPPRS